jgi:hypothetical protein
VWCCSTLTLSCQLPDSDDARARRAGRASSTTKGPLTFALREARNGENGRSPLTESRSPERDGLVGLSVGSPQKEAKNPRYPVFACPRVTRLCQLPVRTTVPLPEERRGARGYGPQRRKAHEGSAGLSSPQPRRGGQESRYFAGESLSVTRWRQHSRSDADRIDPTHRPKASTPGRSTLQSRQVSSAAARLQLGRLEKV